MTILVSASSMEQKFTTNRECDAQQAMARGLADYVRPMSVIMPGGRELKFENVYDSYADLEATSTYPSAAVYTEEDASYGGGTESPITPQVHVIDEAQFARDGNGDTLITASELVQEFLVDVWANDQEARTGLTMLLQDAFVNPLDWMTGFRLELPHYCGIRATFEVPDSHRYIDTDTDKARRYYRVLFRIKGRVPVVRPKTYARLNSRARLDSVT